MIHAITAATSYTAARETIAPGGALPEGVKLGISDFERVMNEVDTKAAGAMTGQTDTHELVQSIARAELALDTVVAIRDKVVEAYQEIMRMPV